MAQDNFASQENANSTDSFKPKRRGGKGNGGQDPRLKELLNALKAARDGNFSIRLSTEKNGIIGQIFRVFNQYVELNEWRGAELLHVSKAIGEEGRLTERAPYGK